MKQKNNKRIQRGIGEIDLFVSTAREREWVQSLQLQVKGIIQEHFPEIDPFIEQIEQMGLPVIYADDLPIMMKLSLWIQNIKEGFIVPTTPGYENLVSRLMQYCPEKAGLDFSTGVILLEPHSWHFSFLAFQFYQWMAFKRGLKGYDYKAQQFYRVFAEKYHRRLNPKMLEPMTALDKKLLRLAIRREREALQFLKMIVDEVFIPLNNAKRLEEGEAQA